MTIFKKIISKKIPADIIFEDELCLAFRDINPQAPVHFLVIPKKEIATLNDVSQSDAAIIAHIVLKIAEIAKNEGIEQDGYRVINNVNTNGGQEVYHIHFHVLGGRKLTWPPG